MIDDLLPDDRDDGILLFQEKRYPEVVEAFRRALARGLPPGLEADTRRRLADALDVLGRNAEAAEERGLAGAVAAGTTDDPDALAAWADLRKREGRCDDACRAYEQALRLMPRPVRLFPLPPPDDPARALVMAKLALAHHSAGRPGETVRWAEASLRSGPEPRTRLSMLRMAGVGHVDGGDLAQAEGYYRKALEWAEAMGRPADVAANMAGLAGFERKRGNFAEAIAACRRAAQIAPIASGLDLTIEAECLREMGRFEESRAVIRRKLATPTSDKPWAERRMQAVHSLGLAWLELAAENPEAARAALDEAREGLKATAPDGVWPPPPAGDDARLLLWCDATEAHVHAQSGRADDARRLRESVTARLAGYATDAATQKTVLAQIGRASLVLGDLAESRRVWEAYLACKPFPAALPTIYYLQGQTLWRLGETEAARALWAQAAGMGIDSLDARRARARLEETAAG